MTSTDPEQVGGTGLEVVGHVAVGAAVADLVAARPMRGEAALSRREHASDDVVTTETVDGGEGRRRQRRDHPIGHRKRDNGRHCQTSTHVCLQWVKTKDNNYLTTKTSK